jgi:uncharacterized spore protein YtfJ
MDNDQMTPLLERITSAAQPNAAYSQPLERGAYTVITASEVLAAGGFGMGAGSGPVQDGEGTAAGGSGGGGGGMSQARPVAVIAIGPDGVKVEPVVDVTKIALAGITAWGTMAVILVKLFRGAR